MVKAEEDPVNYYQKIFEDAYNKAKANKGEIHADVVRRRTMALSLKAIAVFGGIAVTAGLPATAAHVVGIAISVAVAIDYLLMNHLRLITLAKADNAYKHLLQDTANEHSDQLGPILQLKKANQEEAMKQLIALIGPLKTRLDAQSKEIQKAVEDSDIKALNAYSLEPERQASKSGA